MPKSLVYAVHGFLGQASDWQAVESQLPKEVIFVKDNLFSKSNIDVCPILQKAKNKATHKIFIGYSYGGRLGLKLLAENPSEFDHYIFVSTNPGFASSDLVSREQRKKADLEWANKISTENWNSFIQEWNNQSVFKSNGIEPKRDLASFDLTKLKDGLINNSLASQPDYRSVIAANKNKISWIVGEQDTKYVEISKKLVQEGYLESFNVVSGGHRLLFDNPNAIAGRIRLFI